MPAPKNQFSRPSISISAPEEKREWKQVNVKTIEPGDLIPGYGLVVDAFEDEPKVVLVFKNGDGFMFNDQDTVHAFVKI